MQKGNFLKCMNNNLSQLSLDSCRIDVYDVQNIINISYYM